MNDSRQEIAAEVGTFQNPIKSLHTIARLTPNGGGPSRTVPSLCESIAAQTNIRVCLLTQRGMDESMVEVSEKLPLQIAEARSKVTLLLGLPLRATLHQLIQANRPDLLHDHGVWLPNNHYVAAAARHYQIPLMIHPRGMLEPWALAYRSRKKQLAMQLYQRRDLKTVSLFFAASAQEAESIRRLGVKQPVAIIPNGVELPQTLCADSSADQRGRASRTALFLSRIHPKKGLLNLVEAWGRLRPEYWRLRVAGPDEGGHLAEVMRRVRALGLESSVEYVGEVEGDTKAALFESADLFVLPSFSENFGVVVAEALAYGVPVITTHGTPWEGLVHRGCGWSIEPTTDALAEALREALSMDPTTLQAMGDKGRAYAGEFNWAHIARETAEVYRWVLGQGPMPACVITD